MKKVFNFRCRISGFCVRYSKYFRINAANKLIIESKCVNGCQNAKKVNFKYRIQYKINSHWENLDNASLNNFTMGDETTELTIFNTIFDYFKNTDFWKVHFDITIVNEFNQSVTGSTFINFRVNKKPYNGDCKIDLLNGIAYHTNFKIECKNWIDDDGYIIRYEYFGNFK